MHAESRFFAISSAVLPAEFLSSTAERSHISTTLSNVSMVVKRSATRRLGTGMGLPRLEARKRLQILELVRKRWESRILTGNNVPSDDQPRDACIFHSKTSQLSLDCKASFDLSLRPRQ